MLNQPLEPVLWFFNACPEEIQRFVICFSKKWIIVLFSPHFKQQVYHFFILCATYTHTFMIFILIETSKSMHFCSDGYNWNSICWTNEHNYDLTCAFIKTAGNKLRGIQHKKTAYKLVACRAVVLLLLVSHTLGTSLILCRCCWEPWNQCTQARIRVTWFWITQGVLVCIIH